MSDDEIARMIEDCVAAKKIPRERGGPGFSKWEEEFVDSISDQYAKRGWLRDTQIEMLERLWKRI